MSAEHVLVSVEHYVAEKQRLLRQVGYEDTSAQINLKTVVPPSYAEEGNAEELFVDLSLGLVPKFRGELVASGWQRDGIHHLLS